MYLLARGENHSKLIAFQIYSAYDAMLKEYVQLLGGNSSTEQIKELLDFEMQLANVICFCYS